jgi:hypothetical protein
MDIKKVLENTFNPIKQIFRFWLSIFGYAITASFFTAISLLGLNAVVYLFAYLKGLSLGEITTISDYFGPRYFDGAKTLFGIILVVFLLHGAAQKYKEKEIESSRMALDDLDFSPVTFEANGMSVQGIRVHNRKPVVIRFAEVQIAEVWTDGIKHPRDFIVLSWGGPERFMSSLRNNIGIGEKSIFSVAYVAKGKAQLAIQPDIEWRSDWSSGKEVVTKKDNTKYFFLEVNKKYLIKIRMNAELLENAPQKAFHVFIGTLLYDGSKFHLKRETIS